MTKQGASNTELSFLHFDAIEPLRSLGASSSGHDLVHTSFHFPREPRDVIIPEPPLRIIRELPFLKVSTPFETPFGIPTGAVLSDVGHDLRDARPYLARVVVHVGGAVAARDVE